MTTDTPPPPAVPSPREFARRLDRPGQPAAGAEQARRLECLACERTTDHVRGPATIGKDGVLLVQWWTCAECRESNTVG